MADWKSKNHKTKITIPIFFTILRTGIFFALSLIFPVCSLAKENTVLTAAADFKNYEREDNKLWEENYIQWELYDSEKLVKPVGQLNISYTLYIPAAYLNEIDDALSVVHGAVLVDEKKQYMGITQNRGQSWFEPTCNGNGGLAMLRWDTAADEQAAADYASCKLKGDFYVIKVKNAPLSSYLNYDFSKFISKSKKVSLIPTIRIYGVGVSGQTTIMLDDVKIKSKKRTLFYTDCTDIGQEDGIFTNGQTAEKSILETKILTVLDKK